MHSSDQGQRYHRDLRRPHFAKRGRFATPQRSRRLLHTWRTIPWRAMPSSSRNTPSASIHSASRPGTIRARTRRCGSRLGDCGRSCPEYYLRRREGRPAHCGSSQGRVQPHCANRGGGSGVGGEARRACASEPMAAAAIGLLRLCLVLIALGVLSYGKLLGDLTARPLSADFVVTRNSRNYGGPSSKRDAVDRGGGESAVSAVRE